MAAQSQPSSAAQSAAPAPSQPAPATPHQNQLPASAHPSAQSSSQADAPDSYADDQPSVGDQTGQYMPPGTPDPANVPGQVVQLQPATSQPAAAAGATPAENASPLTAAHAQTAESAPPAIPVPAKSNDPNRQRVNDECANLLAMANSLKAEMDKTTKDELNAAVVIKAGQIEQLARKVRDDMRPTMGKN